MEVFVGTGKDIATWTIPKALLSHHSEFFRAACNGPFKEGLENRISLPDADPIVFQAFVRWLYFAALSVKWVAEDDDVYLGLSFWVLDNQLIAPAFQDCVMRRLYNDHAFSEDDEEEPYHFTKDELVWCWSHTAPNSLLRMFVLDMLAQHWAYRTALSEDKEGWRKTFAACPELCESLLFAVAGLAEQCEEPVIKPLETYLIGSTKD
jgi:hypothetical protein